MDRPYRSGSGNRFYCCIGMQDRHRPRSGYHRQGHFGSIVVLLIIIARILKVRDDLFSAVCCSSTLHRLWDLFSTCTRSIGPYDKIVHFFSGILLASLDAMIMSMLLKRAVHTIKTKAYLFTQAAFAFFFSSAFAGIWEIFEFTADRLSGGDMQRGMVDTVTDIIAGNTGALTYFLIFTILIAAGKARIDDKLLN